MMELPSTRWVNQVRAFDGTMDAIDRGVRSLCVTSPTGSGKSTCIFDVLRWAKSESKSAILYTDRKMLFSQICRNMEREGIDFGMRASGYDPALLRSIQVAMIQTEAGRSRSDGYELHPADVVVVDEAHKFGGESFQAILNRHKQAGAFAVGYTATPLDLVGYDELLIAGTPSECRSIGAIVAPRTYAPDEPDLRHIRQYKVGEDLSEAENAEAIMRPGVFGRVIAAWKHHNPNQLPTVLFGPDVKGSLFFAKQFVEAGVPAAHMDGDEIWLNGEWMSSIQEHRDLVAEMHRTGQIKIVCNRFVMREGIDWPWIQCLILASVFGSLTSYLQAGGRGLRAFPGKERCLICDHAGNWWRHGSLAEDRMWELGMTNKQVTSERAERFREKKDNEPILCPNCKTPRAAGKMCRVCGHESHKGSRVVVQIDGSLRAVRGEIFKPRRVKQEKNTEYFWKQAYYAARNSKRGMTFKQAETWFMRKHGYYPPRTLPLMPKEPGDWARKVAAVPYGSLIPAPPKETVR